MSTATATYRAAVVRTPGGPDAIEFAEIPVVEPGPGQVRVEVAAAAVNPVDIAVVGGVFHRLGVVTQPEWTGIGWDFAGTVAATGDGVDLAIGTPVAGFVGGIDRDYGSYAEQLVISADEIAPVPEGLDLPTAATVPLNATTAEQLLELLGDAPVGADRLLVTGAAGAVGTFTVPLARQRGWKVTGLARPSDEEFVRSLGADFTATAEPGWDAVIDAAASQEIALALVRDGGRFIGVLPASPVPVERGITVQAISVTPDGLSLRELLARVASGELVTRVHATVALDQVADAHRAVAAGGVRGRYVLVP